MNDLIQYLEGSRKRIFINSAISVATDIIVIVMMVRMGRISGWSTALAVLFFMLLGAVMHGRTVLFQLNFVPQYLFDWMQGKTARDMVEEAAAKAGISVADIAEDIRLSATNPDTPTVQQQSYLGERYMYFFYVDRVYIFPRASISWIYFTGWRLMTRFFHWEVFYRPHIGLTDGTVADVTGYVFTWHEYDRLVSAHESLFPQAIFGYSKELLMLFRRAPEKFLAIRFAPNRSLMPEAECVRLMTETDPPEGQGEGMSHRTVMMIAVLASVLFVLAMGLQVFG